MATSPPKRAAILSTDDGLKYFAPERELAVFGFMQAHMELVRGIDHALHTGHGLSLKDYELLNRLGRSEGRSLRMTDLAELILLSLSRVSRLVDALASRGLVERRACSYDKRVSYVALTDAGCDLLREAQDTFLATVEERFLGQVSEEEMRLLADVFGRLATGSACRAALTGE
jgi:MarR family transcriptional regulator, 2-MHQ and catechol-resistance regulon repressor